MTKVILAAVQTSSNHEKESKDKARVKGCIEFLTVHKMIYKFLTYDRIIFIPTKIPKFTKLELANKLNISLKQLSSLQMSKSTYKQIIGKINPLLIELYCSTKWQKVI